MIRPWSFLTESLLVVIDPAQDSRHDVDGSPQRLQIAAWR
jgi:hypothetical protein